MNNTDELIKNITGSNDYMKELSKVVGNITNIDLGYFADKNKVNILNDEIIRSVMKNLPNTETKHYFELSIINDFNNAIIEKKKKNGKIKKLINDNFRPKVFIKSPFFKMIKLIEKTANNLIEAYDIDTAAPSMEQVNSVLKTNPELMDVKNFFGYHLKTDEDIKLMLKAKEAAHKIIDNYMLPMYDVKKTMEKNWGILSPMFKSAEFATHAYEIKDMLYLFMIANYRTTITENSKYYMKLFMEVINKTDNPELKAAIPEENVIANMDPARFLELLDTINLDSISQKKSVYNFALRSKDIIKRIAKKDPNDKMEDIIKDIQDVLIESQKAEQAEKEEQKQSNSVAGFNSIEADEHTNENNDILSNI